MPTLAVASRGADLRDAALVLAATVVSAAAVAAFAWRGIRLPDGQVALAAGLGVVLGLAGGLSVVLLLRGRRELDASGLLLSAAAEDLATAYAALAGTNRTLHDLAEARDRALTDLQAVMRERDAFLAAVSHDLKTPLTLVKGHTDLLRGRAQRLGGPEAERLDAALETISGGALQMERMIEELLDLAKQRAGQPVDLDPRPTDLVALVRRVVTANARVADRHRITIRAAEPVLIAHLDAGRFERAVSNVVSNAVKYSPLGGEVEVTLSREGPPATAVLAVRDEGVGIPAADVPRVFDQFYRAANAAERAPGTGLGLASARQTVERHGGTIAVESQLGAGSTFTIRLPL